MSGTKSKKPAPLEAKRLRPDFASDEKRKQAALYFASGWGHIRTAHALGLSPHTVRDWKREYDAGRFNMRMSCYVYDEAFKARVVAMRRAGCTWREIREETGIGPATVMRWMAKEV